jgi:hypothetical protein
MLIPLIWLRVPVSARLQSFIFSSVNQHRQIMLITESSDQRAKPSSAYQPKRHTTTAGTNAWEIQFLFPLATNNTTNCRPDPSYIHIFFQTKIQRSAQLDVDDHHLRIISSIV